MQVIQAGRMAERTLLLPDRVAELLDMCLRSTYGGEFYKQSEGATMGSPVSAVVASVYMEFFWRSWLLNWPRWYVDDASCIFKKSDVDGLLYNLIT